MTSRQNYYKIRSVRTAKPETSFGRTKNTAGALIEFTIFVLIVLVIYALFGGFIDW